MFGKLTVSIISYPWGCVLVHDEGTQSEIAEPQKDIERWTYGDEEIGVMSTDQRGNTGVRRQTVSRGN